jgi:hypothetical protein
MARRSSISDWRRRAYTCAGLALASCLLMPGPAGASVGVRLDGTFSITPARHFLIAVPPARLAPTEVANTTQDTMQVRVFPVLLDQAPSGAFTFDSSTAGVSAARSVLSVGPGSFNLAPGASRRVGLLWHGLPANTRAANVGVIYQAIPPAGPSPVRIVEQLLGVNILRLPGHYRFTGRLTGVHVTQSKPRALRFTLSVQNTGEAVVGPSRLVLTLRDRYGTLLLQRQISTDIVLPGATRDFAVDIGQVLPTGQYTVRGHAAFGSSHRLAAIDHFELVGPDELPTSQLRVGSLTARGDIDRGAKVDATLQNTGTAAGNIAIDLSLYRLTNGIPGQRPIATRHLMTGLLAPGRSSRLASDVGRLGQGTYRLTAFYQDSSGIPQTLVADFEAQRPLGILAQLRGFEREHLLLAPLLLLVSAVLIIPMLIRERRLKRALATAEGRDDGRV